MEKLAIVMPVYNEEEAIGAVLDQWVAALDALKIDYTINPYNDGSKDGSYQVIQEKAAQYPGKVIAHTKPNGGHGPTILQGYREAAAAGYDWVFQIDSDDEMGPEGFAGLWSEREKYDFLVGIRDGRKQALPRKIISAVSRLSVRLFYGKSVWDVNTPYRLMRVSAFQEVWNGIPADTFAPNVIISGMAARLKLRCFETRVPQRDRQTGEVSIKKWKLFKAAAKSFWQTISFAIFPHIPKEIVISSILSLIFLSGIIVFSNEISLPWCDEVNTIDMAVNIIQKNEWSSHLWPYTYNILHMFLQIIWLSIFGISHISAVSLGAFLAFIAFEIILWRCCKHHLFKNQNSYYVLTLFFWLWPELFSIIVNARIDTLNMIFFILTVDALWVDQKEKRSRFKIFIYSFFLMFSGVYSIPLIAFLCVVQIVEKIIEKKDVWNEFKNSLASLLGIFCGFFVCLIFYICNHNAIHFLYTYFSFNATVSGIGEKLCDRIGDAYLSNSIMLGVMVIISFINLANFKSVQKKIFILIASIPLVMCLAGRYVPYYHWLFYLPAITFIAYLLSCNSKNIFIFIFSIIILVRGAANIVKIKKNIQKTSILYSRFNPEKIKGDIVLLDFIPYYQLKSTQNTLWSIPANRDLKMKVFIDKFGKTFGCRNFLFTIFKLLQKPEVPMPYQGFVVAPHDTRSNVISSKFNDPGFALKQVNKDDDLAISVFHYKNQTLNKR